MKPVFVTFEGVDGSGKSSQIAALERRLKEAGVPFVLTREPGGTCTGEAIRKMLLDPKNSTMSLNTEVLLYCASRAQHVNEVIRPALARGNLVVCERYVDSTIAYQCYGGGCDLPSVKALNEFATGGLMPDLTILLDVDPQEGKNRRSSRGADRIEQRANEYYKKVRQGYLEIAREDPARVRVVDAGRSPGKVSQEVSALVLGILGL